MAWSLHPTMHCRECHTELANKEILMLLLVPPSITQLAARKEKENVVLGRVDKIENIKDEKRSRYCPYQFLCRTCRLHVANELKVQTESLVCFKTDNVYFRCGSQEIRARYLKQIKQQLIGFGIEQIEVSHLSGNGTSSNSPAEPSEPMIYLDASELTFRSRELDSLTNQIPRDYQRELFLCAMRGNTLICLPTGSGKTLVAAMVLSCMKKLNPRKLMVFLTDRIPLAYQQSDYIKTALRPELRVKTLVGSMEDTRQYKAVIQALIDKKVDVLVLTHQLFLNLHAAQQPVLRVSDISVIVFDEAHHCQGNHPYNQIMQNVYKRTPDRYKPIVLGLTASPAEAASLERSVSNLQALLDNMCCRVFMPTESNDLIKYSNTPDTNYFLCHKDCRQTSLDRHIEQHIRHLTQVVESTRGCQQTLTGLPVFSSNFRGALRRLIDRCHGNRDHYKALVAGEHAMHMLSVAELGNILGFNQALERLKHCICQILTASSPKHECLRSMLTPTESFQALKNLAETTEHQNGNVSGKYERLVTILQKFVSIVQGEETSRGIIFVSVRMTAFKLCERIRDIPEVLEYLKPAPFVGHGQGGYDGMAWTGEQEEVLKRFRSGGSKLLVSTSVLEEGLDVPVCNLVVRFEGAATLRALVQSRGRASRRPDGTFVVICSDSKEENDAKDVICKEENMNKAVKQLMQDRPVPPQAELHGCKVKKADLSSPEKDKEEFHHVDYHSPRVTVTVRNLPEQHRIRVIDFLEKNFEVMSSEVIQSTKEGAVNNSSSDISFDLQPIDDSLEFRSKDEFLNHVSKVWCSRLVNPEEEPLPIWLQPTLSRRSRKPSDPIHLFSAQCMFLGTFVNRSHFRCEWPLERTLSKVLICFDHSLTMVTVFLQKGNFKLEFRYDELEDFFLVDNNVADSNLAKVYLTIRHPPRLYRLSVEQQQWPQPEEPAQDVDSGFCESVSESSSESEGFSTDEEYPDTFRNVHVSPTANRDLLSLYDDESNIWERVSDILNGSNAWSQCLTLSFDVPSGECGVLTKLLAVMERRFGKKTFYCTLKVSYGRFPDLHIPDLHIPVDLAFDVKYAAQSVLSLHPGARRANSSRFGSLFQSKSSDILLEALKKLKKTLEDDKFCDPEDTFQQALSRVKLTAIGTKKKLVPVHCALIKRAVITPTRLLVYPPEVMVKNRVLRHFDSDNFLCVSLRDEDLSKLSAARGSIELLLDRVNQRLNEGLEIAGEQFLFLGSSNSQLRNHSCWFAKSSSSPDDIRLWMGDLSRIRCVGSYMARMGQCFSTSLDAVGISISEGTSYDEEHDVMSPDGDYCFSDGVGRISEELASKVVKKIAKKFRPSAFQIRFAGYKGVLAIDPRLSGKTASFRPSMRKFESPHYRLEILQTSRPQVVYLNHQVIMLLSNLGVPDEVFVSLQNDMFDKLSGMLVDEHSAVQLLSSGAKIGVSYCKLSGAGIPLTTEPFFKSLLVAMYRHHVHDLLSRARILLPPSEARLMMGVMDERGVLKPGQVFVQYSAVSTRTEQEDEFNRNDKRVLTGPVVVTRNPCLHPGDVRRFEAVEAPQLNHLVDCVVFPRQGSRPHPNEMAGGDLDGDLYFVCWNKNLLPRKPNFSPMDYKPAEKKNETEPITVRHMTKFVVDYIRSDQLGMIDNTHKALADTEKNGVESKICLHLAELHSLAVDAPKTGMWPEMPWMKPIKEFPDFMMKNDRKRYPSEKVLGKLYRRCLAYKDSASERFSQKARVDKAFLLPGYESYVDNAKELYQQYCDQIQSLMSLYGIETEAELFTGCFLRLRNRLRKEKSEIAELVSDLLFTTRSDFRRSFFEEFGLNSDGFSSDSQVSNKMRLKASAWYFVAYCDKEMGAGYENKTLFGFPWVVSDVLVTLKQEPTCGASRVVNVCTTVGESVIRLFREEKAWLLDEFKTRVRVKNAICRHLSASTPGLRVVMAGSSASFLFHSKSDLDLCILPTAESENIDNDIDKQVKVLKGLKRHLQVERQGDTEKDKNLFKKVRLVNKETFPVLACKTPTEKLTSECHSSPILACDLGCSRDVLPFVILVSNYMMSYPDLLPIFRLIHRWGHVSGVSCHANGAGITSNVLISLLLFQCLRDQRIKNFVQSSITLKKNQLIQGQLTDGKLYMGWENVVRYLDDTTAPNPDNPTLPPAGLDIRQLGELLMAFFKNRNALLDTEIPDPLADVLGVRRISELLDRDHVMLIKEHMQQAYQQLALYGDAGIMLAISGSEIYHVIFLSPLFSSYITGVEKSKAQAIAKKTGATSITLRPRFPRSLKSLILEVRGSEPAIRAVERELDKMVKHMSRDRVSLMSGCFVNDASVLLFENSRNVNDYITLNPYYGAHHPSHDGQVCYVPLLNSPSHSENAFRRYKEKVIGQFDVLERDFDPQIHGYYEFAVYFGRVYVFSVPHSLLEDNEAVTIAMLRANRRIRGLEQSSRSAPRKIRFANEDEARSRRMKRRPKKTVPEEGSQNKRKRVKPSRSSFFTVVETPERVKTFLRMQGFQSESLVSERYLVDVREDDAEFGIKLDQSLKFKEIKIPNLRWCVVDVKRAWIIRNDPDNDVIHDGRETDIRFLLQSRSALQPDDIRDTKYFKYQKILEASSDGSFKVNAELWKNVKLIRFSRSHKFSRSSSSRDFFTGLTVYLDEVTEYSRPTERTSEFGQKTTRWEVCVQPTVPEDLTARTALETFLDDVWKFSFALSSFVSSSPAQ